MTRAPAERNASGDDNLVDPTLPRDGTDSELEDLTICDIPSAR